MCYYAVTRTVTKEGPVCRDGGTFPMLTRSQCPLKETTTNKNKCCLITRTSNEIRSVRTIMLMTLWHWKCHITNTTRNISSRAAGTSPALSFTTRNVSPNFPRCQRHVHPTFSYLHFIHLLTFFLFSFEGPFASCTELLLPSCGPEVAAADSTAEPLNGRATSARLSLTSTLSHCALLPLTL